MRILAIGTLSDIVNKRFTGQSVMFDGIVEEFLRKGNEVIILNIAGNRGNSNISRIQDYTVILFKLIKLLITNKFNICYLTTSQSKRGFFRDYAITLLLRVFNVRYILHQFGANYNQLLDTLGMGYKRRLTKMLHRASKVLVEGQYMKSQFNFLSEYDKKVLIVPNGLPIVGKNALKSKIYNQNLPFKLFYLSNLIWSKGFFDILQAVDLLANKYHKKIECVFAGRFLSAADDKHDSKDNEYIFNRYIKEKGLEKIVKYYQGSFGNHKDQLFSEANVFLLPSYYINEGQPVSILEAMAYGCVPIVTNYRHIPMMVNENNGIFVEPQNPESIASAIIYLIENPDIFHRKSEACIKDYQDKFSFEKYATNVIDCIQNSTNTN